MCDYDTYLDIRVNSNVDLVLLMVPHPSAILSALFFSHPKTYFGHLGCSVVGHCTGMSLALWNS